MLRPLVIAFGLIAPVCAGAQEFFTLKGHGGPIMDIAVASGGQIATASFDNALGLWTGTTPQWLEGHRAAVNTVTFLEDGRVVSASDDFAVMIWDVPDGAQATLGTHKGKVMDVATAPDGTLIASASWDGTIGLWPLDDSAPRLLQGHAQGVNAVAFAPDGKTLYSASTDGTIRLWDVAQGAERQLLVKHGFGINELILNADEGWLAYGAVDGVTRIADMETGEAIADFTLNRRPILAMAFHAGSANLAVGDGEGFIMVIDTATRQIARDFRATRRGPIWALAFSPNGQNIHAAGIEDIMYSWPLATMDAHGQMSDTGRSFLEDPETLPNGERQFKRKCSICHTLTPSSQRRAGPSLFGVFGRRAGSVADYAYSDTLSGSEIVWSDDTIDKLFDLGPDHFIPGSKMPMQRITKPEDRQDLIAFLRAATAREGN